MTRRKTQSTSLKTSEKPEIEETDNVHEMMLLACAALIRHNKRDQAEELRRGYMTAKFRSFRRDAVALISKYVEVV